MDHVASNIRDMEVSTGTGKDVQDTKQISGLASNSLSGTNTTKQYETSGGGGNGPYGGLPSGK